MFLAGSCLLAVGVGLAAASVVGRPAALIARPFWEDARPSGAPPEPTPALLERGRAIFEARCATCHGPAGDGHGGGSAIFSAAGVHPRDLSSGLLRLRSNAPEGLPAPEDVFRTITVGIPSYGMPAFDYLSEDDRWAVVFHIRTLSRVWETGTVGPPVDVGEAPPRTPALLERGKRLFTDLGCISCHGETGRGDGVLAVYLTDVWGDSITPRDYRRGAFKGGGRPRDIVRVVLTGLVGAKMPSVVEKMDPIDREALWSVAYYVESLREGVGEAAE